jgi:hypothetical protein
VTGNWLLVVSDYARGSSRCTADASAKRALLDEIVGEVAKIIEFCACARLRPVSHSRSDRAASQRSSSTRARHFRSSLVATSRPIPIGTGKS